MKKREQFKNLLTLGAAAGNILIQTLAFSYVWFTVYAQAGAHYFVNGNYALVALYAVMAFFINKAFGLLNIRKMRLFDLLFTQAISVVVINGLTYLQLCLIARWKLGENLLPILWLTGCNAVVVVLWNLLARGINRLLYPPKRLLLIYGAYSPDNLIRNVLSRRDKYAIEEAISIDEPEQTLWNKMDAYDGVVLTDIPAEKRNELLKHCFSRDIRCYCVPKISDILIRAAGNVHMFDTSLMVFKNMGLSIDQRFLKRLFDIVFSAALGILILPLMGVVALAIKVYDGGPVFFRQDRLTKDGKVFKLIKFRSMRVQDENAKYVLTRKNDDRITPVGKILRATHVDELPQIYNILKGDMSFVGPRPECPGLAETYGQIVPEFDFRLKVKAGLTGYAQVYGRYNTTPYDKLKLDLSYIVNYSFLLDMKLIALTVKVLFQKDSTEGIEDWQSSAASREQLQKIGADGDGAEE